MSPLDNKYSLPESDQDVRLLKMIDLNEAQKAEPDMKQSRKRIRFCIIPLLLLLGLLSFPLWNSLFKKEVHEKSMSYQEFKNSVHLVSQHLNQVKEIPFVTDTTKVKAKKTLPVEVVDLAIKYNENANINVITMDQSTQESIVNQSNDEYENIAQDFKIFQIFNSEQTSLINEMKAEIQQLVRSGVLVEMKNEKSMNNNVVLLIDKSSQGQEKVPFLMMMIDNGIDFDLMFFAGDIQMHKIKEIKS